jgi:hypothetical protein
VGDVSRLSPERLVEIRDRNRNDRIAFACPEITALLAELDAVTRERDGLRDALDGKVDYSAGEAGKYLDAAKAGVDYAKRHAMYPEHPDITTAHYALNRLCLLFAHLQKRSRGE